MADRDESVGPVRYRTVGGWVSVAALVFDGAMMVSSDPSPWLPDGRSHPEDVALHAGEMALHLREVPLQTGDAALCPTNAALHLNDDALHLKNVALYRREVALCL